MNGRNLATFAICLIFLLLASCSRVTPPRSSQVVDVNFVDDLVSYPTLEKWEAHSPELLYLVQKGDRNAIRGTWRVLAFLLNSGIVYEETNWLAMAEYDQVNLEGLEKLSQQEQIMIIRRYNRLDPLDWNTVRDEYLRKHGMICISATTVPCIKK